MELLTTCKEYPRIIYRSPFFSRATFFNLLILILAIVSPYLIAFKTHGFWSKIDLVREQPQVLFKHEVLLYLDTKDDQGVQGYTIWTTLPVLESILKQEVSPFVLSREADDNLDGLKDSLDLEIAIPMPKSLEVNGVHVFLIFDVALMKYTTFRMESLIFASHETSRPGNRLDIYGDLDLVFKEPFWHSGRNEEFNTPVISRNSYALSDYEITNILHAYTNRNVSTRMKNVYQIWKRDETNKGEFLLKIHLNYAPVSYECRAGLWNAMKWAWVQYFAIFVVVSVLLKKFQRLVYRVRLFETIVETSWEKKHSLKPSLRQ